MGAAMNEKEVLHQVENDEGSQYRQDSLSDRSETRSSKDGKSIEDWAMEHPVEAAIEAEANVGMDAASRVQSRASARTLSAIPDGGVTAWLQVLGAFMLFFNTW